MWDVGARRPGVHVTSRATRTACSDLDPSAQALALSRGTSSPPIHAIHKLAMPPHARRMGTPVHTALYSGQTRLDADPKRKGLWTSSIRIRPSWSSSCFSSLFTQHLPPRTTRTQSGCRSLPGSAFSAHTLKCARIRARTLSHPPAHASG